MKRILVLSPKGGSGKSHLTRQLAVAAALDGLRVATADLDPQRTLTKWTQRRPSEAVAITHYPVTWDDADLLVEKGGVEECDLLIVDTPPSIEERPARVKRLVTGVDLVLVPARPTYDDVESAAPFTREIRSLGRPAIVILNAVVPRVNVNHEKGILVDAGDVCPIELRQRTDYARAAARGLAIPDLAGHVAADEVNAVWRYVRRQLGIKAGSARRVAA